MISAIAQTLNHCLQGRGSDLLLLFSLREFLILHILSTLFLHIHGRRACEGEDLFVDNDNVVFMQTVRGPIRVDVIYRRIDDDYLDPQVFREDSLIGVRGLMRAWRSDKVTIANAPGTGVADDKLTYSYVPDLIEYYLGEKPVLPNVKTYRCNHSSDREFVLANIGSWSPSQSMNLVATGFDWSKFKQTRQENSEV